MPVLWRQRLGITMMFLFLPINGPMWRMTFEVLGHPLPWPDWQVFIGCLTLFVLGGIFTFTPKLRSLSANSN